MRILQVIPVFSASFGGPVRVVHSISKELAKRHEVTVYTTSALDHKHDFRASPAEVEINGYPVFYFPRIFRFSGFDISLSMARAFRKTLSEYDIVHLHSWRHFQDILVHYYAKKCGVPYVLQAHGSLPRIVAKQELKWIYDVFLGRQLLRDASKVIATTQMEAEQYKSRGVFEEKIAVVPNGIDQSEFNQLPMRGVFRKKYGIEDKEKLVLYIGRIHRIKGIDMLIKAFARLQRKLHDARLAIVGPDDGYLSTCKEIATEFGVERKILFVAPLYGKDKLEVYVDADVCVFPSRYEIFGMTILEACACAKPVIATEVSGAARDAILDGYTGFLVQTDNVLELADVLRYLLTNQVESEKIGVRARERVMKMFSIQSVVDEIENVYKGILCGGPVASARP